LILGECAYKSSRPALEALIEREACFQVTRSCRRLNHSALPPARNLAVVLSFLARYVARIGVLERPVQSQGPGQEDRQLATRHVSIRAEVTASAASRDTGSRQRLDGAEVDVGRRNVTEGRASRRRADLKPVAHAYRHETDRPVSRPALLDVNEVPGILIRDRDRRRKSLREVSAPRSLRPSRVQDASYEADRFKAIVDLLANERD